MLPQARPRLRWRVVLVQVVRLSKGANLLLAGAVRHPAQRSWLLLLSHRRCRRQRQQRQDHGAQAELRSHELTAPTNDLHWAPLQRWLPIASVQLGRRLTASSMTAQRLLVLLSPRPLHLRSGVAFGKMTLQRKLRVSMSLAGAALLPQGLDLLVQLQRQLQRQLWLRHQQRWLLPPR